MTPVLSCEVLWLSITNSKRIKFLATTIRKQKRFKDVTE